MNIFVEMSDFSLEPRDSKAQLNITPASGPTRIRGILKYAIAGVCLSAGLAMAQTVNVEKLAAVPALRPLEMITVGGRVITEKGVGGHLHYTHQWPGTYFEAAFEGEE